MIIFNQKEQFDNLTKNGFEKYPNFRDLMILAKEWHFIEKKEIKDVKTMLIGFCESKFDGFNVIKSQNLLKKVIKKLEKTQNYTELPEKIVFYKGEMNKILEVENKNYQKILFVLCCLSKLKKSDGIYLNSSNSMKLSDVFDLCRIKKTSKEQEFALYELNKMNLISVDLRPLLKYHPLCLQENGEFDFEFEPNSNLIEEFLKRDGTPINICRKCGKSFPRKNNRNYYCNECGLEMRRERARAFKEKKKQSYIQKEV